MKKNCAKPNPNPPVVSERTFLTVCRPPDLLYIWTSHAPQSFLSVQTLDKAWSREKESRPQIGRPPNVGLRRNSMFFQRRSPHRDQNQRQMPPRWLYHDS